MIPVLLLFCALSADAQSSGGSYANAHLAAGTCPWLTAGTAAGALGGGVSATISVTDLSAGTCRFVRRGEAMEFLEIRVTTAPLAGCPAGSLPLQGIGNETQRCRASRSQGIQEEMASGRVRAVHFTVVMAVRRGRRGAKPQEPDDDKLARIAEEVAGNLY